jgi:hypothetical protein
LPGPSYLLRTDAAGFPIASFGDVVFEFRVTNAMIVPGSATVTGGLDGTADGSGDLLTLHIPAVVPAGTLYDTPDVSFDVIAGSADSFITVSLIRNESTAVVIAGGSNVPVRTFCTPRANTLLAILVVLPPRPEVRDDCKNGGWQNYVDGTGEPFRNQGLCIRFVNQQK